MSIRGLDNRADRAPAGWTTADQRTWAHPWESGLDDYYDELAERGRPVPTYHTLPRLMPAPNRDLPLEVTQRTSGAGNSSDPLRAYAPPFDVHG